ncbi:MAG: type II secretion system protein [Candidatus Daviesbacteria bacterium]
MKKTARGFTLVELLIVMAILAILGLIIMVVINPLEMRRRSNDTVRVTDLNNLQQAINVAAQEATTSGTEILCFNTTAPCLEGTFPIIGNTRSSNGSGWVKVDLSSQKSVSLPTLPIDPINDEAHHYHYYSDGSDWEIDAVLESTQQNGKMENDGGSDTAVYETGSNLQLIL